MAPTLPMSTLAKASASIRGKRTNAEIRAKKKLKRDERDDMEFMFDTGLDGTTKTPARQQQRSAAAAASLPLRHRKKETSPVKKKTKTPVTSVKMSLPGQRVEGEDDETSAASSTSALKYKSKVEKEKRDGGTMDVSPVSTLPPSPRNESSPELPQGADESSPERQQDDEEEENSVTQQEEEIGVAGSAASGNQPQLDSPDDDNFGDMPDGGGYDDDDDDIVAPQAPSDDGASSEEDSKLPARRTPVTATKHGRKSSSSTKQRPGKIAGASDTDSDDVSDGAIKNSREDERDTEDDSEEEDQLSEHNVVHDPETPKSARDRRAKNENKLMNKKKRGYDSDDDEKEDDEAGMATPQPRSKAKTKKKKKQKVDTRAGFQTGRQAGPREYYTEAVNDVTPDNENVRRSRRPSRRPLEFWRNEKQVFEPKTTFSEKNVTVKMPVVTAVIRAKPTPFKKVVKKQSLVQKNPSRRKGAKKTKAERAEDEPFDDSELRRKYNIEEGESAYLFDDTADDSLQTKVVSYQNDLDYNDLPLGDERTEDESQKVGKAGQAFNVMNDDNNNYPGHIMGSLILPPSAIKDPESVGPCAQTFTVVSGQRGAVEVAYADPDGPDGVYEADSAQRFLLGPGDMFRVPPGNCYRLQNHSTMTDCMLTWTIIRPHSN